MEIRFTGNMTTVTITNIGKSSVTLWHGDWFGIYYLREDLMAVDSSIWSWQPSQRTYK
jgi:hypothetical protein